MLFVTLNQHWIFLTILWYGLVFGILYKLGQIVCNSIVNKLKSTQHLTNSKKVKKHKFTLKNSKKHQKTRKIHKFFKIFTKNVIDFILIMFAGGTFILLNYLYNFGEIRLFTIIAYLIGIFVGILIVKFVLKMFANINFRKHLINSKISEQ